MGRVVHFEARDGAVLDTYLHIQNERGVNGVAVEGPVLNTSYRSFVGMHPLPVRHGKSIGELARQFQCEEFPRCDLFVLEMKNWRRD